MTERDRRDRQMTGRDRVTKVGGRDGYREMWLRADSNREGRAGGEEGNGS